MKLIKTKTIIKIIADFKFGILLLFLIAFLSSLGSIIEQDQSIDFYKKNYSIEKPIYGFIDYKIILNLGLDHLYNTSWFLFLIILLGISLIVCTFSRQFPLLKNSKEYFFKTQKNSYKNLPFLIKFKNLSQLKEILIVEISKKNFYIFQTKNFIYGYKGLIGRLSPIIVHLSLILILSGSSLGAVENFKAQEILPKGEIFHIQNLLKIGNLTNLPQLSLRVNDFWLEYNNQKIHQFYSNISILNNFGQEIKESTISVNNPLKYNKIDFYQSDWNLIGLRCVKYNDQKKIIEFPLFLLKNNNKSWVTWIVDKENSYSIIFNNLGGKFYIYDKNGILISEAFLGEKLPNNWKILDIISSTGLLIKYDPSIPLIYTGFALLMITTILSYLPYTQIWIFNQKNIAWVGGTTNRGKIQLEVEFENFLRKIENLLQRSSLRKKANEIN